MCVCVCEIQEASTLKRELLYAFRFVHFDCWVLDVSRRPHSVIVYRDSNAFFFFITGKLHGVSETEV